jgi:hypothetical protein
VDNEMRDLVKIKVNGDNTVVVSKEFTKLKVFGK